MIVSLKVLAPTLVGVATGLALVIVGKVTADGTLVTIGVTLISGSLAQAGIGYRVPHVTVAAQRLVRERGDRPS